jgi:hypothetical protein
MILITANLNEQTNMVTNSVIAQRYTVYVEPRQIGGHGIYS